MKINRSTRIIHDVTAWALPVQAATAERVSRLREDGSCRVCGDTDGETVTGEVLACGRLDCIAFYDSVPWARCSCCGELLLAETPCRSYLTAWSVASESFVTGIRNETFHGLVAA